MTIIELKPNGKVTLPMEVMADLKEVRHLHLQKSDKGLFLVPVHILPVSTNRRKTPRKTTIPE